MKIKLQINGESMLGTNDLEMYDSEYEIEMTINEDDLGILSDFLDRMVRKSNDEVFNWNIVEITD